MLRAQCWDGLLIQLERKNGAGFLVNLLPSTWKAICLEDLEREWRSAHAVLTRGGVWDEPSWPGGGVRRERSGVTGPTEAQAPIRFYGDGCPEAEHGAVRFLPQWASITACRHFWPLGGTITLYPCRENQLQQENPILKRVADWFHHWFAGVHFLLSCEGGITSQLGMPRRTITLITVHSQNVITKRNTGNGPLASGITAR